jgi:hypothetical protein
MRNVRRGQATTEYFVLLAVFVIALVAAAWVFVPLFDDGAEGLADDAEELLVPSRSGMNGKR